MPKFVRYTANKIYPQCAVQNRLGLPALPFDKPATPMSVLAPNYM